jgi:hypothetical protein
VLVTRHPDERNLLLTLRAWLIDGPGD